MQWPATNRARAEFLKYIWFLLKLTQGNQVCKELYTLYWWTMRWLFLLLKTIHERSYIKKFIFCKKKIIDSQILSMTLTLFCLRLSRRKNTLLDCLVRRQIRLYEFTVFKDHFTSGMIWNLSSQFFTISQMVIQPFLLSLLQFFRT